MAILSNIQWPQKSFQFDWKANKWSFQVWKAKVLVQSPSVKDLWGTSPSASQWPARRAVLLSEGSRELPLHTCSWLPPDTVFGFKRLLQSSHFKSRASVIMDTHIRVLICQINIQSHCVLTSYAATLSSKNGIIRNNGKLALKDLLYFSAVKKQYS